MVQNTPYKPNICSLKVSYRLRPAAGKTEPEPNNQKNPGSDGRKQQ